MYSMYLYVHTCVSSIYILVFMGRGAENVTQSACSTFQRAWQIVIAIQGVGSSYKNVLGVDVRELIDQNIIGCFVKES